MTKYIELEFPEAQYFMAGGEYASENLRFDPDTNTWFIPEDEYYRAHPREEFPITSVSRADLECKGYDVDKITDAEMEQLAKKMSDDYCEQMFWISMDILAEHLGFPKKETDI